MVPREACLYGSPSAGTWEVHFREAATALPAKQDSPLFVSTAGPNEVGHCHSSWDPSLVTCQEEGSNVTSPPDRTLGKETPPWQIDFTWRWHSLLQKMTRPWEQTRQMQQDSAHHPDTLPFVECCSWIGNVPKGPHLWQNLEETRPG